MQRVGVTYGSILAGFRATTLEGNSVTLVLETLWSDETLDLWSLGVWFGALLALFWLHLTTNHEFTDLYPLSAFDVYSDSASSHWRLLLAGEEE